MTMQNTLQAEWSTATPAHESVGTRHQDRARTSSDAPRSATSTRSGVRAGRPALRGLFLYQKPVLPGFGLSLGVSVLFISLVILFPLSALFVFISDMSAAQYWAAISDPREIGRAACRAAVRSSERARRG